MRYLFLMILLIPVQAVQGYSEGLEIGDRVDMRVYGEFTNGTVFQPLITMEDVEITYTGFTDGFTENILGMRVGEEKTFMIPKERGYDEPHELANEDLVFTVGLLSVVNLQGIPSSEPQESNFSSLLVNTFLSVLVIFSALLLFSYSKRIRKASSVISGQPAEVQCTRCGSTYTRQEFGRKCPACENKVSVRLS